MLNETKRSLIRCAKQLPQPYESYSIDELADAYCEAKDTNNEILKSVYGSALILRFWYKIDKMYRANTVAPSLTRIDFYDWVLDGIEYACKYRGWKDPDKRLNAQQCINKCIDTIKLQKYYDLRLDKRKAVNYCMSLETPICGDGDDSTKTLADMLESTELTDDTTLDMELLIQNYINKNRIIEAILIDNIVFNDVQRYTKKTVKAVDSEGKPYKYVEHHSEFWLYKLIQNVSKLPATYKNYFMKRYEIAEEKLSTVLDVIDRANNQKLYKYSRHLLEELKLTYAR